jgi:hypothetical protein
MLPFDNKHLHSHTVNNNIGEKYLLTIAPSFIQIFELYIKKAAWAGNVVGEIYWVFWEKFPKRRKSAHS